MQKIWTIFKHEYTRHVLRKRFLVALLSLPAWLLVMVAVGAASVLMQLSLDPVGYVDPGGFLAGRPSNRFAIAGEVNLIDYQPYPDEQAARAALDAGTIQAYFVLPVEYPLSQDVSLVYHQEPDSIVVSEFRSLLRGALLANQPPEVAQRVLEGPALEIQADDSASEVALNNLFRIIAPFAASFFLLISVFTSAGYLLQAVVDEKENRTMEILATSVSPAQIMLGKIAALICVGWTQVFLWMSFPLGLILLIQANTPFLSSLQIDWSIIWLVVITAVPTFVMIAGLMAAIGASVTEAREGQQVMSLITLLVMSPYILLSAIVANPGGLIAVSLSFFPLTAALTLLLRVGFGSVPAWQIATSVMIQVLSAAGALWLAARLFRLGMLRYGQRLRIRELLRTLSSRKQTGGSRAASQPGGPP